MKYSIPLQRSFSIIYMYNEKRYVGGLNTSLFCAIIPTLFPYFLPFWYPYILLHFEMFFITCLRSFFFCSSRCGPGVVEPPCFGLHARPWCIIRARLSCKLYLQKVSWQPPGCYIILFPVSVLNFILFPVSVLNFI